MWRLLLLSLVLAGRVSATEVEIATVTDHLSNFIEKSRKYAFKTNGSFDDRFWFVANQSTPPNDTWDLRIFLRSTGAVSSAEYLTVVDACIALFLVDVPDAQISELELSMADDSKIWGEVRSRLVPIYKDRIGTGIPKSNEPPGANAALRKYEKTSVPLRQLAEHFASRLNEKTVMMHLLGEGGLAFDGPEALSKKWEELLQLPRLGIWEGCLHVHLLFEPRQKKIPKRTP